jgi:putative nucleotidyltransferase with HDIG domain
LPQHRLIIFILAILWIALTYLMKLPPMSLSITGLIFLYWVWKEGWSGMIMGVSLVLAHAVVFKLAFPKMLTSDTFTLAWALIASAVTLGVVAWLRSLDIKDNVVQRKAIRALELGTMRLSEAQDAAGVMAAGLDAVRALELAPHLAFVQPIDGKLRIVLGRGGFSKYEGQSISNASRNPRQTQVDSLIRHLSDQIPEAKHWFSTAILVGGHGGRSLGTVVISRENKTPFTSSETALLTSLTRLFGAHLGQVSSLRELERSHESAHMTLGLALEYRDYETAGHTGRVVEMAEIVGQHLGLSTTERESLRAGAYLHDIGKMVIADQILLKPDVLTFEEREEMEKHAVIGFELLAKLDFVPTEALEVVKHHHERWDGGGYPSGLTGNDIPYLARIFAVIDLFDALTHARPYKRTYTALEAIDEITSQGGKQLDPFISADFVTLWKDNKLKIKDREVFSFTTRWS